MVAAFRVNGPIAQVCDGSVLSLRAGALAVHNGLDEVQGVQIVLVAVGQEVAVSIISLNYMEGGYLSHHDLLRPEEGSKVVVEVHFLLVALAVVAYPEALRISLQPDIEETQSQQYRSGEHEDYDAEAVAVVEPC